MKVKPAIPIAIVILIYQKKKELKKQYKKQRKAGSYNHERAAEADMSKIDSAIKMFKRAISQGFKVDYVLMDSWFTCWEITSLVIKRKGLHLIGMYKGAKTKFMIEGKKLTYSQIRNELGKPVRCRKLGYYYKQAIVEWNGNQVKLFFSKQGKNGKWKTFLTTDVSLSFIAMVKIYQLRWCIEVFFKEGKQLFGLGKCQSNDFDAQIADTTMVMIRYMIASMKFRFDNYESKGAIFEQTREKAIMYSLGERLWGLFMELVKIIEVLFDGCDSDEIIMKLVQNDQAAKIIGILLGQDRPPDYQNAA